MQQYNTFQIFRLMHRSPTAKKKCACNSRLFFLVFLCLFGANTHTANSEQQELQSNSDLDTLFDLSLEDLAKVTVSTVSRKEESLLRAPISAYSLSGEQIRSSGATTLVEVFRMIPGVFVREISNGVLDIQIRGLNNLPSSVANSFLNSTLLVMVDNRVIYSYWNGGVLWYSIPV